MGWGGREGAGRVICYPIYILVRNGWRLVIDWTSPVGGRIRELICKSGKVRG